MKCIKSIRETKNVELGVIKRVNDIEAESSVKSGYWMYVPKSDWKSENRKSNVSNEVTNTEKPKKEKKKSKK